MNQNCRIVHRNQSACLDAKKKMPRRKPDMVFSGEQIIETKDLTFEMKYVGRCHSKTDILIYVPELKVLFVGDLMFRYGRPGIRDKSMDEKDQWHCAVAWTEKRMQYLETLIGGHGQILIKDDLEAFHAIILEK